MGYSKQIYTQAMDLINSRRLNAEKDAEAKQAEIYKADPEIERINKEISASGIAAARAVFYGKDVNEEMGKLKMKNLALQDELKGRLISKGYSVNALEPNYTCKKCSDTGYYEEDNKTVVCDCLKNAMIRCTCDELNASSPLSLCTFDSFSLSNYDMDVSENSPSPYEIMSKILNFCIQYAKNFSKNSKSLLLRGATGLGKTHLSLAIANEVINKGCSVIYVSAPTVLSKLEKQHFSNDYNSEEETLNALLECDLLIIDDLGTEFVNNFSVTEIYNIFNSRLLQGKPVIINTNLTLKEIESNYSQRFLSRLVGCAIRLDFLGRDVRTIDRKKKNF